MFPFKRLWMALPLVGLLASCSEEIEVAAPYQNVTVVYGLLDIADTAQYIRIQKAYMDENRSALSMAQIADSSFYQNLEVHFQDFSYVPVVRAGDPDRFYLDPARLVSDDILGRVDLGNEGHPKDANGAFFNSPNYAYKTKRQLVPGHTYRLLIKNLESGETDTAQTPVVNNAFTVFEFNQSANMNFPAIRDNDLFQFRVNSTDTAAQMFEGIVRFHYVDVNGSQQTDRSVDYRFAAAAKSRGSNQVELSTPQRSFYTFLRESIGPAPTNVLRYMDSVDYFVWTGGADLLNYQTINSAQGGITADQIKPIYSNIRSRNKTAYGLFSTRTRTVRNRVPITDRTLDSLINSPVTRPLAIRGRSDH